jgi:hypothetical protein
MDPKITLVRDLLTPPPPTRCGKENSGFFFSCSQAVPFRFLKCPQVLNVFPNMFPRALLFIPYSWAKFYSCKVYNQPEGGDYNISILF